MATAQRPTAAAALRIPFARSYWVDPGRLLAGAYPGDLSPPVAEEKLRALLDCGIRTLINLTERFEVDRHDRVLVPYEETVDRLAGELGVDARCVRHPVRDLQAPSPERMAAIQAEIDGSLAGGRPVYVHCWGGRGRTGTVVGVWLVRRGLAGPYDFADVIARLRAGDLGGGPSPETREQLDFVRRFAAA
jgi:protein-tyrosine phosphatase